MPQKSATVAIINQDKRLLILRRGTSAPWMPGRYCLPGGKLEKGETLTDCAIREIHEETGIILHLNKLMPLNINYHNGFNKTVFVTCCDDYYVSLNWEHDHYQWVSYQESTVMSLVPTLPTTIKALVSLGHLI